MNWTNFFNNLSDEEKDKIAVLRVMECTNGIVQYAHRDGESYALPIEETREAMKFSMGCMKRMEIPLKDKLIRFAPETEATLRKVRELYISGVKNGNEEDYREFMRASEASAKAVGLDKILQAASLIKNQMECPPIADHSAWGASYLFQFL